MIFLFSHISISIFFKRFSFLYPLELQNLAWVDKDTNLPILFFHSFWQFQKWKPTKNQTMFTFLWYYHIFVVVWKAIFLFLNLHVKRNRPENAEYCTFIYSTSKEKRTWHFRDSFIVWLVCFIFFLVLNRRDEWNFLSCFGY